MPFYSMNDLNNAAKSLNEKLEERSRQKGEQLAQNIMDSFRGYKKKNVEQSNDSSCYIATAIYENPNCDEVMCFRTFRDNYLLKYQTFPRYLGTTS